MGTRIDTLRTSCCVLRHRLKNWKTDVGGINRDMLESKKHKQKIEEALKLCKLKEKKLQICYQVASEKAALHHPELNSSRIVWPTKQQHCISYLCMCTLVGEY